MKKHILPLVLAAVMLLPGCDKASTPTGEIVSEQKEDITFGNTAILPENVIQVGETFDYSPHMADGHFECTVTNVWVVSEQSQCPPKEDFYPYSTEIYAYVDGKEEYFDFDEWFVEGGLFDWGGRLVMVDITVKNIDAVAWLHNDSYYGNRGMFYDEYAFQAYDIMGLCDLTVMRSPIEYFRFKSACYYSLYGDYHEEDITGTIGYEPWAFRVEPGETVSFTLGYLVPGGIDGKPVDLSLQWLNVKSTISVHDGLFIDTNLG